MKASKFNIFTDCGEGEILAYNSMTGGLVKFDTDVYSTYLKIISEDEKPDLTDPMISAVAADLKRGGFLVDDKLDEVDYLKVIFSKSKYAPKNALGLTIAVTTACNFGCAYCFENGIEQEFMSREVESKIIEYVEKNIKSKDALRITWYGGEPLLALDTIYRLSDAFMRISKENKAKYSAGIITNGYLLNKETAAELVKRRVGFAQITLDGGREKHDYSRILKDGSGTFDTIMNNLKDAVGMLPIDVRINLGKHNINSFQSLLDDLDAHEISRKIAFLDICPLADYEFSSIDIRNKAFTAEEFSQASLKLSSMAIERGIKVFITHSTPHMSCSSITQEGCVIGPDGRMYKCWDMVGREDEVVGVIDKKVKLRDGSVKWLAWDCFGNKKCLDCNILPVCLGGCPRKTIIKDEVANNKEHCNKMKYNINEWVKLMYIQNKAKKEAG